MLNKFHWILPALFMLFFITGCAGHSFFNESKDSKISMEQRKGVFDSLPSDSDIINEILSSLTEEEGKPDYNETRTKLANFIQEYPLSNWAEYAKALMLTIDNVLALQEKVQTQSLEMEQANREKEKKVKDFQLTDKIYRGEITRLQQEIEVLKKDILILKRLEIQLDRREKMLK
ncbi:MAG: hypothetical protein ABFD50_02210, partial [Smithella sp.]